MSPNVLVESFLLGNSETPGANVVDLDRGLELKLRPEKKYKPSGLGTTADPRKVVLDGGFSAVKQSRTMSKQTIAV